MHFIHPLPTARSVETGNYCNRFILYKKWMFSSFPKKIIREKIPYFKLFIINLYAYAVLFARHKPGDRYTLI